MIDRLPVTPEELDSIIGLLHSKAGVIEFGISACLIGFIFWLRRNKK